MVFKSYFKNCTWWFSKKKKPPNIGVGVSSLWPSLHGIYNLMWKCNVLDQNYKHDSFVTKSIRSFMFRMAQGYDQC